MSRDVHIRGLTIDGVTAMLTYLRLMGHIPADVLIFLNGIPYKLDAIRVELEKMPGTTFSSGIEIVEENVDVTSLGLKVKHYARHSGMKKLFVESES